MSTQWITVKLAQAQRDAIKQFIEGRPELGYKSVGDFVADAVRRRLEEFNRLKIEGKNGSPLQQEMEGVLRTDKLLEGPQVFFDPSIWHEVSERAKQDLTEASMCLLIQTWIAAIILSLRAVEDAIQVYYQTKTASAPGNKGLKDLITELEKRLDVSKPLLNYFEYIREIKTSVDSSNRTFTQREANILFHQACGLIHTIYEEFI